MILVETLPSAPVTALGVAIVAVPSASGEPDADIGNGMAAGVVDLHRQRSRELLTGWAALAVATHFLDLRRHLDHLRR